MNEKQVLLSGRILAVPNRFSAIRNTLHPPPPINSFLLSFSIYFSIRFFRGKRRRKNRMGTELVFEVDRMRPLGAS